MNNYHTHTQRCKHAIGDVTAYANCAIGYGIEELGISDHTPLSDGWTPEIRMGIEELDGYDAAIHTAQRNFKDKITIFKSMECDWMQCYKSFYEDELLGKRKYDYLIGSVHFFISTHWEYAYTMTKTKNLIYYSKLMIEAMESGIFAFIAHPDLFGGKCKWDKNAIKCTRDIAEAAEELKVPLEINGNGFLRDGADTPSYPITEFWEIISDYSIDVVCNSDAHSPNDVNNLKYATDLAKKCNIKCLSTFKEIRDYNPIFLT